MASALRGSIVKCLVSGIKSTVPASAGGCGKLALPVQIASRGLTLNRYLASISSCRHSLNKYEKLSSRFSVCQRCNFHTEGKNIGSFGRIRMPFLLLYVCNVFSRPVCRVQLTHVMFGIKVNSYFAWMYGSVYVEGFRMCQVYRDLPKFRFSLSMHIVS